MVQRLQHNSHLPLDIRHLLTILADHRGRRMVGCRNSSDTTAEREAGSMLCRCWRSMNHHLLYTLQRSCKHFGCRSQTSSQLKSEQAAAVLQRLMSQQQAALRKGKEAQACWEGCLHFCCGKCGLSRYLSVQRCLRGSYPSTLEPSPSVPVMLGCWHTGSVIEPGRGWQFPAERPDPTQPTSP